MSTATKTKTEEVAVTVNLGELKDVAAILNKMTAAKNNYREIKLKKIALEREAEKSRKAEINKLVNERSEEEIQAIREKHQAEIEAEFKETTSAELEKFSEMLAQFPEDLVAGWEAEKELSKEFERAAKVKGAGGTRSTGEAINPANNSNVGTVVMSGWKFVVAQVDGKLYGSYANTDKEAQKYAVEAKAGNLSHLSLKSQYRKKDGTMTEESKAVSSLVRQYVKQLVPQGWTF